MQEVFLAKATFDGHVCIHHCKVSLEVKILGKGQTSNIPLPLPKYCLCLEGTRVVSLPQKSCWIAFFAVDTTQLGPAPRFIADNGQAPPHYARNISKIFKLGAEAVPLCQKPCWTAIFAVATWLPPQNWAHRRGL